MGKLRALLLAVLAPIQVRPDDSGVQPATVWSTCPPEPRLKEWHDTGYREAPRAYGI